MLLQQIAKWCDADVIVAHGGAANAATKWRKLISDLAELEDPRGGGRLAQRTVVIANTSNMPVMAREASVHTGATVAEYYRDCRVSTPWSSPTRHPDGPRLCANSRRAPGNCPRRRDTRRARFPRSRLSTSGPAR
ncbi:hypothetical protein ACU686_09280 [Yinghuangia aomiensis]